MILITFVIIYYDHWDLIIRNIEFNITLNAKSFKIFEKPFFEYILNSKI